MAIKTLQEVAPVQGIKERFLTLLKRAREVKPSTEVEPELPPSEMIEEVRALGAEFSGPLQHSLVEAVAQDIIYDCVVSTMLTVCGLSVTLTSGRHLPLSMIQNSCASGTFWTLFKCAKRQVRFKHHHVAKHSAEPLPGQCSPGLVVLLLEDLFDTQTTNGCRKVFQYLETRRSRIVAREWDKKFMSILRSCNELLRRRLSRAEDAVFCGRVFFFLFQIFPLGDKSSVNLRGEFHTANTTRFEALKSVDVVMKDTEPAKSPEQSGENTTMEEKPTPDQPDQQEARTESKLVKEAVVPAEAQISIQVEEPKVDSKTQGVVSNDELYPIFWRLQEYFSEPPKLFAGDHFSIFKHGLQLTIAKFKSIPTEMQQNTAGIGRGTKRKRGDMTDAYRDVYNPKYLTDRELFDLEVRETDLQLRYSEFAN